MLTSKCHVTHCSKCQAVLTTERLVHVGGLQVVGAAQIHVDVLQAYDSQVGCDHPLTVPVQVLVIVIALEREELAALLAQRLDEDLLGAHVRAQQQPGGRCRRVRRGDNWSDAAAEGKSVATEPAR